MELRQIWEERERQSLSALATLSVATRGREYPEQECEVRSAFQRDRDRIIHSKAFRRLKLKTQVFIAPEGDHYRTRLTHTLEVSQISRTVARALQLNEDLTEAIAMGHDLGHTPFGHAGEEALNRVRPEGFRHNLQSVRVVEVLEKKSPDFPGLNLTWEVRNGIRHHTGSGVPATLEGQIVKICDRVAYINHDIDDATRAGIISPEELPPEAVHILGSTGRQRIDTMVKDLILSSQGQPEIRMSPQVAQATATLRSFLFETVYVGSVAKTEESRAQYILEQIYAYYCRHPEQLPKKTLSDPPERMVTDYVAGMTDIYAMEEYRRRFLPSRWTAF